MHSHEHGIKHHNEKYYYEIYAKYDRYLKYIEDVESDRSKYMPAEPFYNIEVDFERAKEELSEEQLKILVVYSTMKRMMNSPDGVETIDLAEEVIDELESLGFKHDVHPSFIKSIFNFDAIYIPLYDFLKISMEGKYRGEKKSEEYINGIIDSIIVLRRFQKAFGFGDMEWDPEYNHAIEEHPNNLNQNNKDLLQGK